MRRLNPRWVDLIGGVLALTAPLPSAQAANEPTVALVFKGPQSALELSLRQRIDQLFTTGERSQDRELRSRWGSTSVIGFNAARLSQIEPALRWAEEHDVHVVLAAEVQKVRRKSRRRRAPRLQITAVAVAGRRWLGSEAFALRQRGSRRQKRWVVKDLRAIDEFFKRAVKEAGKNPDAAPATAVAALPSPSAAKAPHAPTTQSPSSVATAKTPAPLERVAWTHAERLLVVEAYGLTHARSFEYVDNITRNLREYGSGLSFGVGTRAVVYPLTFRQRSGTTRRLGWTAAYAQDFGLNPSVADAPDVVLSHQWREWLTGPVVAWDFRSVLLAASLTYGRYEATFEIPPGFANGDELPGVSYENLKIELSGRWELSSLSIFGSAAYTFARRGGDVGDRLFPNSAFGGIFLRGGVARHVWQGVEVFAAARYDHFFYDLRPQRGDVYLAGGALDLHFTAEIGMAYAY